MKKLCNLYKYLYGLIKVGHNFGSGHDGGTDIAYRSSFLFHHDCHYHGYYLSGRHPKYHNGGFDFYTTRTSLIISSPCPGFNVGIMGGGAKTTNHSVHHDGCHYQNRHYHHSGGFDFANNKTILTLFSSCTGMEWRANNIS